MANDWQEVTLHTWRLELEDGYLYRVTDDRGTQMVYVPSNAISQSLYDLSETLGQLRLLFEETTCEVSGAEGVRAIRTSDIGN